MKKYLTFVYNLKREKPEAFNHKWLLGTVSGTLIDCIPQNIIVSDSDPELWNLIDQEWNYEGAISLSWLLFRVLLITVQSNTRLGYNEQIDGLTRYEFFKLCYKSLGYDITADKLEECASFESELQHLVSGRAKEKIGNWYPSYIVRTKNYIDEAESDVRVKELTLTTLALNEQIQSYQLNEQLIKSSLSWKITKPLRTIRTLVKRTDEATVNWMKHKKHVAAYLSIRVQNGIKRHGLIKSVPLAINAARILSTNQLKKIRRGKIYRKKITELEQLILNETNYIDLFHIPMGWNTPLFQRFQHLSLQAAHFGGLAIYGGHIQVDKELFVYEREVNGVIVFDALDNVVNQRIKEALKKNTQADKVVRIQSIDLTTTIDSIVEFQGLGFKVVYEYIDEINEEIVGDFPETVINRHKWILDNESIYVVATSTKLFEEVASHRTRNMLLSTNGVDIDHWRKIASSPPEDLKKFIDPKKNIIGYHGALAKWIDYELLRKISDIDELQLVLIGYEHDDSFKESGLSQKDNVHYLGSKSYFELPQYSCYYDVGILPFKKYKLTESVSPVKLFEYMAMGKPIVTTDLIECLKYKSCLVAESTNHEEFIANIKLAIRLKNDEQYLQVLNIEALNNSWQSKMLEYLELVGINVKK